MMSRKFFHIPLKTKNLSVYSDLKQSISRFMFDYRIQKEAFPVKIM